uniref:Uncharacterized protein n=1 Tax=Anopheles atroparvus TaxID=41427 RepID=A0A182JJ89_ANOAO
MAKSLSMAAAVSECGNGLMLGGGGGGRPDHLGAGGLQRGRRAHHAVLDGLEVEEGGRVAGAGPAERAEALLAVLHVQALLAHGGELAALGHEHHQEDGGRGGDETERKAGVPVAIGDGESAQRPAEPDRDDAADREPDVRRLAVVVADAARLDRQDGDEQDQEDDVDERQEQLRERRVAEWDRGGGGGGAGSSGSIGMRG